MKELNQYYRQVASWLPCGGRLKKQLMGNIKATVGGYLADHPEADFAALQAHFGTPQQIAIAFVEEMETEELLRSLHIRRKVVTILLSCVIAIVAIWGISVTIMLIAGFAKTFGYGVMSGPIG